MRKINSRKTIVSQWIDIDLRLKDLQTLAELGHEENDENTLIEISE